MNTHRYLKALFATLGSIVIVVAVWSYLPVLSASAATAAPDLGLNGVNQVSGLPNADVRVVAARIIRTFLGLLGIVALVLVLYGGYTWLTAGGNEEKIGRAKNILVNAGIGLLIILSSYAITSFVISKLVAATTGGALPAHCTNGAQDEGETGADCGGDCNACAGGGGGGGVGFSSGGLLTVAALPGAGDVCVRNTHLAVVFSQAVNVNTLQNNAVVTLKDNPAPVPGVWQAGDKPTTAIFVPQGSCAPDSGSDCLQPKTAYRLTFSNPSAVKSADGGLTLNCSLKSCGPVDFVTGEGVDRQPPTIAFVSPLPESSVQGGSTVPVKVNFSDDNGVQNVSVFQGNNLIDTRTVAGCQKTGSLDLNWNTGTISVGKYELEAGAIDGSGGSDTATLPLYVRPGHCFNATLEADLGEKVSGPPACGGECGVCGGDSCNKNTDCASGFCQLSADGTGICVDRLRIDAISPFSGAPGTFVTINGNFFGAQPGRVYFASVASPDFKKASDWVEAKTVSCGAGFNPWAADQILVEVPAGAKNGPILVTKGAVSAGNFPVGLQTVYDFSNDDWGPKIRDFGITSEVRPGLCGITPQHGFPGTKVQVIGKNLGFLDSAADQVWFGNTKAVTLATDWLDTFIKTTVPALDGGAVTVKITANSFDSNTVKFIVDSGESEDSPTITAITPGTGARGEYITISGTNFGSTIGTVWFKATPTSEAITGDFTFPKACQAGVWRDDQIVVKFPLNKGDLNASYFIQINTAGNKVSTLNPAFKFSLKSGTPAPGVCGVSPVSGPVPFPPGQGVKIVGEYFGTQPEAYFWTAAAKGDDLMGRAIADQSQYTEVSDKTMTVRPPAATITGPVVVSRAEDKKISNPAAFSVLDCTKNNNTCPLPGYSCCAVGVESGVCRPNGELCQGATRSTGYAWRFNTQSVGGTAIDALAVPHVVERCDVATDQGKNLPSPSPSASWDLGPTGDHHNVCRTALSVVEFSLPLDQKTVNNSTLLVRKCSAVDGLDCANPVAVDITSESYLLRTASRQEGASLHHYLQILPQARSWEDNAWYQIVLTKQIKSLPEQGASSSLPLAADKPCSAANSAYCYTFKTGSANCKLKAVVVTPYTYWTKVLESPIKYHGPNGSTTDVYYYGNGLSDQHCVMMDVSGFDWSWTTGNQAYSEIYGKTRSISAQATAKANTVAIGLKDPENAVNIVAEVTTSSLSYKGVSPLTIDLSDPEVVDYWPNCQEACLNSEVGVRFNGTMSLRNLPGAAVGGSVQLLKCKDENCRATETVLSLSDVKLDEVSNYTVLKLANSGINSTPLEPNSLYQVILSSSSTDPTAPNQLWSASRLGDPTSVSKPYRKEFSWRFRTKNQACKIADVEVRPDIFYSQSINQKTIFGAQPFSSPDSCSAKGQALNPWSSSWNWSSSDQSVATVTSFSTVGSNKACTAACIRRGSDIPASQLVAAPICGNGVVEAGEDCDGPNKNTGCSLNCLFTGSTAATCGNGTVEPALGEACDPKDAASAPGCTQDCRRSGSQLAVSGTSVNASICGNGLIGDGEDCDLGIAALVSNRQSRLNCSTTCQHQGSTLSSKWCADSTNRVSYGGFTQAQFIAACAKARSQCGDGVTDPNEDPGCDDPNTGWDKAECTEYCRKKSASACVSGSEGCDDKGRYLGSSLYYSTPSYCGDGVVGIGEEAFCETGLEGDHQGLFDPWSLASGVGYGIPTGNPPSQASEIKAATAQGTVAGTVSGSGQFVIACGYQKDQDCQGVFGSDYGVGQNSCCYARPKLTSTYPKNNEATVCPNTYLEAVFDRQINGTTLTNETVLIARGSAACTAEQADVTQLVVAGSGSANGSIAWYQRVWQTVIEVFARVFSAGQAQALGSPAKWCVGSDKATARVAPGTVPGSSRVLVSLTTPLAFNTDYAVILKEGVKDVNGVSIGKAQAKNLQWKFSTADKICELSSVSVTPNQSYFSVAGATSTLEATSFTTNGAKVQPIPTFYDWDYSWGPTDGPYVSLLASTSSLQTLTAKNRNGELDVRATARITANKYTSVVGNVATGKSHVIIFLCENPWPPKALYYGGKGPYTIFPYEDKIANNDGYNLVAGTFDTTAIPASPIVRDGYFNFSTYYCADQGAAGTADDLPYLHPTVQVAETVVSASTSLKRFLFTNSENPDAIGMQVFSNPGHLSVQEWYARDKNAGGQGFIGQTQPLIINGYNAITDGGNNIYVDALNYSDVTKNIYSNIYLFSINADAEESTRKVFEQFIKNTVFNTNVSNYRYCGLDPQNPGFEIPCTSDLDCPRSEVCSAAADKLKRNYIRLRDLGTFQNALEAYALSHSKSYPTLQEGTYLSGQTLSVWPSWSVVGNAIGISAPTDPINQLGVSGTCSKSTGRFCTIDEECPATETCVIHDPETAWSTADRRFSFACSSSSLSYRYSYSPATGYIVRGNLEPTGLAITNQDTFIKDFVTTTKFVLNSPTGICNQDQEVATLNQGRCGDGTVNTVRGEQCDPPGGARYGACGAEKSGKIKVDVCTNNCQWTASTTVDMGFVSCQYLSVCGNGLVEVGEKCDDGRLNGKYNHCSKDCQGFGTVAGFCGDGKFDAVNEICEVKEGMVGKTGVCVGGPLTGNGCSTDADCNSKSSGVVAVGAYCKLGFDSRLIGRYNLARSLSCAPNCVDVGPHCGDGVVQSEFGEQCDGEAACEIGGRKGTRLCSKECKIVDPEVTAWYPFEEGVVSTTLANKETTFIDGSGKNNAVCDLVAGYCPGLVSGKIGRAVKFDNSRNALRVKRSASLDLNSVRHSGGQSTITIATYFNGNTLATTQWVSLFTKLRNTKDDLIEKAYSFGAFVERDKITKLAFTAYDGSLGTRTVALATPIPVGQWRHLAVTAGYIDFSYNAAFYVDGVRVGYDSPAGVSPNISYDNNYANYNSGQFGGRAGSFTTDVYPVTIGQSGSLDELRIYNRYLEPDEVKLLVDNSYTCSKLGSQILASAKQGCGDGKVDEGEACDRGVDNGVVCVTGYGKTCSYCSFDCKNTVEVQPREYCGDGVVQIPPVGNEKCEKDVTSGLIYAGQQSIFTSPTFDAERNGYRLLSCGELPQNDYTFQKELSLACSNKCTQPQTNCLKCGYDQVSGVTVQGSVVNVLDPTNSNPLMGASGKDGKLDLTIIPTDQIPKTDGKKCGTITLVSGTTTKTAGYRQTTIVDATAGLNPANYSIGSMTGNAYKTTYVGAWFNPSLDPLTGSGAVWISTAVSNNEANQSLDQWRLFSDTFTIPDGMKVSKALLTYSVDNTLDAYLNGATVPFATTKYTYGAPADVTANNYNKVVTTTFTPAPGKNTINFVVRNWGVAGSNANPTGFVYKVTVDYCPQVIPDNRIIGHAYWAGTSNKSYYLKAPMESGYAPDSSPAKINSNSICSVGDPSYKLYVNDDVSHMFPFPVFAKPGLAQYDLALSPVIDIAKRPDDIRVVVSWAGPSDLLSGGFLVPVSGEGKYDGNSLKAYGIASGNSYYSKASYKGMWYHNLAQTSNQLSTEAFTVFTAPPAKGGAMIADQYVFFVRVNGSDALTNGGIKRASKDSRLKVDVYLPENDSDPRHFGVPSFTFYGTNGIPTANPNTTYWQVFSLKQSVAGDVATSRVVPINKFITEQNFK